MILLAVVREGQAAAEELARQVARETDLPRVRAEGRDGKWFVVSSRTPAGYALPTESAAVRDLEAARGFERPDGARPFASAFLLTPRDPDRSRLSSYDLRSVRNDKSPAYTLQVGVYGDVGPRARDGRGMPVAERRAAAEARVTELRAAGERAFYYHNDAAGLSMVTVGVFRASELGLNIGERPSVEFDRVRRTYPANLVNGKPLMEPDPARGGERAQPSLPVEVPR
ncbi:MAG: hypothetical protein AAF108_01610 [Planctomycetota bacterium]